MTLVRRGLEMPFVPGINPATKRGTPPGGPRHWANDVRLIPAWRAKAACEAARPAHE